MNISTPYALKASFQIFGWDMRTRTLLRKTSSSLSTTTIKKQITKWLQLKAGFSLLVNILTLAAYEQAQRALRGECELDFALCAKASFHPHHNDKKADNQVVICFFMVEVAGLELAASSTRNWRATNCATPRKVKFGIFNRMLHYYIKIGGVCQ